MSEIWTDDEVATLIAIYPVSGAKGAAAALPIRSYRSVKAKAHELQIEYHGRRPWTAREVDLLRAHFARLGPAGIQVEYLPDRSRQGIAYAARRCGLVWTPPPRGRRQQDPTPEQIAARAAAIRASRPQTT
jgi:hypothetical protein